MKHTLPWARSPTSVNNDKLNGVFMSSQEEPLSNIHETYYVALNCYVKSHSKVSNMLGVYKFMVEIMSTRQAIFKVLQDEIKAHINRQCTYESKIPGKQYGFEFRGSSLILRDFRISRRCRVLRGLRNVGILPQHYTASQPEDGSSMDFRNVGILPQHYTASRPRITRYEFFYIAPVLSSSER
jgi:hypothetical protein